MTWSYSGNPASSDLDLARFYIGDTDVNTPLMQDEEISFMVTSKGSARAAAPDLCAAIMAKLAMDVDYTIGPESVKASQRFKAYQELMKTLKTLWVSINAAPSFQDPDTYPTRPLFNIGMQDNTRGGGDSCG